MKMSLTAIFITCSKYSDLWQGISLSKDRLINAFNIEVIVGSDEYNPKCKFNYIIDYVSGKNTQYGKRLRNILNLINTDYVLLMLDDHFVLNSVENFNIYYILDYMKNNNVDYCRLDNVSKKGVKVNQDFTKLDLNQKYAINAHPSIWKTDLLKETVKDDVTPWQHEKNMQNFGLNHPNTKFYKLRRNFFPYVETVIHGCYCVKAKRIAEKNGFVPNDNRKDFPFYKMWLWKLKGLIIRHTPTSILLKYYNKKIKKTPNK